MNDNEISEFLDRNFAKPMYILSLVFLFFVAGVLHFQFVDSEHGQKLGGITTAISNAAQKAKDISTHEIGDHPGHLHHHSDSPDGLTEHERMNEFWEEITSNGQQYHPSVILANTCTRGILLLYPWFIMELCFVIWKKSPRWKRYLLYCLIPPFRLAGRDHTTGKSIWLPKTGWAMITPDLKDRVEKGFTLPMIVIALMVVPLLGIEHVYEKQINHSSTLTILVQMAAGLIWLAFTYEFIVLISIVEKKKQYCKEHWIDIAVILLPLIAFMRIARLGRLMRLQKTARLYRMRGMLMRTYRAILLYNIIDRYILRKPPEKMLADLKLKLMDKEVELNELREQISELESNIALASSQNESEQETSVSAA